MSYKLKCTLVHCFELKFFFLIYMYVSIFNSPELNMKHCCVHFTDQTADSLWIRMELFLLLIGVIDFA